MMMHNSVASSSTSEINTDLYVSKKNIKNSTKHLKPIAAPSHIRGTSKNKKVTSVQSELAEQKE